MSINDRVRHESSKIIFEDHLEIGYNYRMTDIQASVGIKQLEKLDWIIEERRKIAKHSSVFYVGQGGDDRVGFGFHTTHILLLYLKFVSKKFCKC